jgi:hypothetical protein
LALDVGRRRREPIGNDFGDGPVAGQTLQLEEWRERSLWRAPAPLLDMRRQVPGTRQVSSGDLGGAHNFTFEPG